MYESLHLRALPRHLISYLRFSNVFPEHPVHILGPVEFVSEEYHESTLDAYPVVTHDIRFPSLLLLRSKQLPGLLLEYLLDQAKRLLLESAVSPLLIRAVVL